MGNSTVNWGGFDEWWIGIYRKESEGQNPVRLQKPNDSRRILQCILEEQSRCVSDFSQLHYILSKIMKSFVCTRKAIYTTKKGEFTNKFSSDYILTLFTTVRLSKYLLLWILRMKILNHWNVCKTTVDPVVSRECGTWDITVREEHWLSGGEKRGCWWGPGGSKWKGTGQNCIMGRYIV